MARPLRPEYPGAVYHITARGNGGQEIFTKTGDKDRFLDVLSEVVSIFDWIVFAYCLMDNHYHLVIETPAANLSKGMRQLNGIWAQRFNMQNKKAGHLFQGRFKAYVIEKESYLLEVLRYVVLNPVRAGICRRPEDYSYSSYLKTAGLTKPGLVRADWVISQFGADVAGAREAYRRFVDEGIGAREVFDETKAGIFLGSDEFVARHTIDLADERLREIPKAQRPDPRPPLGSLIKSKRDEAGIFEAYKEWGYTMNQIAVFLAVHPSTISRKIDRLCGKSEKCKT
jgi:putative transposase